MEIANVEQAEAWDGSEGEHWARHADRYERSSRRSRPYVVSSSFIGPSDRVLDIGCGAGRSTIEAAQLARRGTALGVDLSSAMLAHARERAAAERVENTTFLQADAQVHTFEPEGADVAISHFGCMFFSDPVAAFTNIAGALRSGGRLALLAWRELQRNEWLTTIRGALALGRDLPLPPPDAPTPFSLADPERVTQRLAAAGYEDVQLDPVDEPIFLGTDADDAFEFFKGVGVVEGLLQGVDEPGRAQAFGDLHAAFKEAETSEGVLLGTSAWLITATRR